MDAVFLGPVTAGIASTWTVHASLHVQDQELTFKLDTGTEVPLLSRIISSSEM